MAKLLKQILEYFLKVTFKIFFFFFGSKEEYFEASKVSSLYRGSGFGETFIYIRFWDSPILDIVKLIKKKGIILDLGCGDGFLANYLGSKSSDREVIGIEQNNERIKLAEKGLENVRFLKSDITEDKLPPADTILLVHVLHHLNSFQGQERLIKKCFDTLGKGGQLIIVEIDKKPYFKYLLTLFVDSFIVPILFEGRLFNKSIFFRSKAQWESLLKKIGFKVETYFAHSKKPFSHLILKCSK